LRRHGFDRDQLGTFEGAAGDHQPRRFAGRGFVFEQCGQARPRPRRARRRQARLAVQRLLVGLVRIGVFH
jgi:hypothetical protein